MPKEIDYQKNTIVNTIAPSTQEALQNGLSGIDAKGLYVVISDIIGQIRSNFPSEGLYEQFTLFNKIVASYTHKHGIPKTVKEAAIASLFTDPEVAKPVIAYLHMFTILSTIDSLSVPIENRDDAVQEAIINLVAEDGLVFDATPTIDDLHRRVFLRAQIAARSCRRIEDTLPLEENLLGPHPNSDDQDPVEALLIRQESTRELGILLGDILTPRDFDIIVCRFVFGETLAETGRRVGGLSFSATRQHEIIALYKLRKALKEKKLKDEQTSTTAIKERRLMVPKALLQKILWYCEINAYADLSDKIKDDFGFGDKIRAISTVASKDLLNNPFITQLFESVNDITARKLLRIITIIRNPKSSTLPPRMIYIREAVEVLKELGVFDNDINLAELTPYDILRAYLSGQIKSTQQTNY